MKKRLALFIVLFIIFIAAIILAIFLKEEVYSRILLALSLITATFFSIYLFFGVGKLVTSLIYGMILAILLIFLSKFDTELIFITTFILFLNPLHRFEDFVDSRFNEDKTLLETFRGSYNSYYSYRKEVKEHLHLPQVKKTFTRPGYLMIRRVLTILMAMAAIFLLIREVNNLVNLIKNFNVHLFFASSYSIIILLLLTVLLYRKGFQSMTNLLTVSIFPPIAYTLYVNVTPTFLGVILGTIVGIIGIIVAVIQYTNFRSRIVYEHYHYYDQERLVNVYANALFEPYVYDEHYRLTTTFTFKANQVDFNKNFHSIIVHADFNKFFITAYTTSKDEVEIFTDFHYKDEHKIIKFKQFLNEMFGTDIRTMMIDDPSKELFESRFFHNTDYIIARTVYLANILKKLEIKSSIIVSLTAYFKDLKEITKLSAKYHVTRLPELDLDDVYLVKLELRIVNVDYVIETKMQELLLDLLIRKGKFVRVSVFY